MEKFFKNKSEKEKVQEGWENVSSRVSEHSKVFDEEIANSRNFSSEEIISTWEKRKWRIGDSEIEAIGVSHVPETFLEFRDEIEKAIQESDLVLTEFAPEAQGFYDSDQAEKLEKIKSKINGKYNLEQIRQAYLKYEREWNLGVFHHEVELLAGKYQKDLAIADLNFSQNPEELFQSSNLYLEGAKQLQKEKNGKIKGTTFLVGMTVAMSGFSDFLQSFLEKEKQSMSRRSFLKLLTATLMTSAPVLFNNHTNKQEEKEQSFEKNENIDSLEMLKLRDLKLAESLMALSQKGYKKIVFIYGVGHLKGVEKRLDNQEDTKKELTVKEDLMNEINPEAFKIYQLTKGENKSEKFVASGDLKWQKLET